MDNVRRLAIGGLVLGIIGIGCWSSWCSALQQYGNNSDLARDEAVGSRARVRSNWLTREVIVLKTFFSYMHAYYCPICHQCKVVHDPWKRELAKPHNATGISCCIYNLCRKKKDDTLA